MKCAIAQITTDPGKVRENTQKIIAYIKRARAESVDLLVFPELCIPGYAHLDLAFQQNYLDENKRALTEIALHTKDIAVIVGFIDQDLQRLRPDERPLLYNSAAIIANEKLLGVQDKTLLPDYDIFFESRYFTTGRPKQIFEICGKKLGIEICEDLWDEHYQCKVSEELLAEGAEVLINISASPFHIGKFPVRVELLRRFTKKNGVPFLLANLIGSFDGYEGEVVFDGRSVAFGADDCLLAVGKSFAEDFLVFDLQTPKKLPLPAYPAAAELHDALVLGIKEYMRRQNIPRVFLGLSGGIDSAVVACLAAEALGPSSLTCISMPSKFSSKETQTDSQLLAGNLGVEFFVHPIEEVFNTTHGGFRAHAGFAALAEDLTEENMQARIRMLILMGYANKLKGTVLNTGNKTEFGLGYCTIYGDMCGGLAVLGDVNKALVYELARHINQRAGRELIPRMTIERAPSAELRDNQTDAQGMGAHPADLAPLVDFIVEEPASLAQTLAKFNGVFSDDLIRKTWRTIDAQEWKRRQAPPGIRVTAKAFGVGRRIPMNHGFA